ncbi:metallophosphoesterase family protein [Sphingomonas sp.]|uniref:metallophosphoesterase family protein n=1 Tax=Sphingomonas sp. TaxID=28214 RepID=UPI003CC64B2F
MIGKFLRSRRSLAPGSAIPAGQRVYAIGDVHGCLAELDRLLAQIDADDAARGPADTTLVFLGDLVDRGPDSARVVERVVQLTSDRADVHCLLGNHEEVFIGALSGDEKALRLFCRIGGHETALSYGMTALAYERADYGELAEALQRLVPAAHRSFLAGCEDMVAIGDYLFVHAGVAPDLPLDRQRPEDLRWIRARFLDHDRPLERTIVHGHTIAPEVEIRPHRIGIDTGAYQSGVLTALALEGQERWVLQS